MKFLMKNIKYIFNYIPRMVRKYTKNIKQRFFKATNVKKYIKVFLKSVEKNIKNTLSTEPKSKSDYRRIGERYYSKKFFFLLFTIVIVIPLVTYIFILPRLEGKYWEPKIVVTSPRLSKFNGNVEILSKDKALIFKGSLENGKIIGEGSVFKDQKLVYKGHFQNNMYSGVGKKFDEKESLIYEGGFKDNLYEGKGILYSDNGRYEGNFESGKLNGQGKYYIGDKLIYEGMFSEGKYSGSGKLFSSNEKLVYSGDFQEGEFSGNGKFYSHEKMIYEGEFLKSQYHGEGILYGSDGSTLYQGNFVDNNIDYLSLIDRDISDIRKMFGTEDRYILYENSFVTFYDKLDVVFEFNFLSQEQSSIGLRKILYLDKSDIDGVFIGDDIENYKNKRTFVNSDSEIISSKLDMIYDLYYVEGSNGIYEALVKQGNICGIIIKKVD